MSRKRSNHSGDKNVLLWTQAIVSTAQAIGQQHFSGRKNALEKTHSSALKETYRLLQVSSQQSAVSGQLPVSSLLPPSPFPLPPSVSLTAEILARSYEQVLDHRPTLQAGQYRLQIDGRYRKSSGSYFTPVELARYLLEATLAPVLFERIGREGLGWDPDDSRPLPPISRWSAAQREKSEVTLLSTRVCDPACGPGSFLVLAQKYLACRLLLLRFPTKQPSLSDVQQAHIEVAQHSVYGIDLDRQAIELARFSLWLTAEKPDLDPDELAPNLRIGDGLNAECGTRNAERGMKIRKIPQSAIRIPHSFDVVIGNPPFANAIEGGIGKKVKERLSRKYPELTGTADLAFYFLALAHRITNAKGAIGLVLPRGVLTSRSTRQLRKRLLLERPPSLIYAPQNQYLFPGANIFVVLLALRRAATCLGSRDASNPRFQPVRVEDENWWAPLIAEKRTTQAVNPGIGERFEIFSSMTTGMAYDLIPFLSDNIKKGAQHFVTTGLIDPGVCHWGKRTCRYLKRKFQRPVIHESPSLPPHLRTRIEKVRRPKILIAGLSNRIEAFLDRTGHYCGAVSTFTILHPKDDTAELSRLCDFLNSPSATQILQQELGANAMGGGRVTLNKDFLRQLRQE